MSSEQIVIAIVGAVISSGIGIIAWVLQSSLSRLATHMDQRFEKLEEIADWSREIVGKHDHRLTRVETVQEHCRTCRGEP